MKKLVCIIFFFISNGIAQEGYVNVEEWKNSFVEEWEISYCYSIKFDSTKQIFDSLPIFFLDMKVPIFDITNHEDFEQEVENGDWGIFLSQTFDDSLWLSPKDLNPNSLDSINFRKYFLESRDFKNINNEKKYLDTIFQYTNNPNDFENFGLKISSKEPFSINIRKGNDFYFVYKKDSILAYCGSGYDCGSNFEILKYSDTTCIKKSSDGSLCLEAKSKYIGVYTFPTKKNITCAYQFENETSLFLPNLNANTIEKCQTPIFEEGYVSVDPYLLSPPQSILKNKNSVKTYSPAIYRVNGTNSKNNKSSNILYGKERAVRYLREE